jgi:small subunit ribosomal protein S9
VGGGQKSQLDALILSLARALIKSNLKFRPVLKKAGLLTRDARERQRRMVGTGGKSRRVKQSPKR